MAKAEIDIYERYFRPVLLHHKNEHKQVYVTLTVCVNFSAYYISYWRETTVLCGI